MKPETRSTTQTGTVISGFVTMLLAIFAIVENDILGIPDGDWEGVLVAIGAFVTLYFDRRATLQLSKKLDVATGVTPVVVE